MQTIRDPRTGNIILADDNGKPTTPQPGLTNPQSIIDRPIDQIPIEEAMNVNVNQAAPAPSAPKGPSLGDLAKNEVKNYALNKGKNYLLDQGSNLLSGGSGGVSSFLGSGGAAEGLSTGFGPFASVPSGITGVPGLDTIVPTPTIAPTSGGSSLGYAPGIAGAAALADLAMHRERIGTGGGYAEGAIAGAGIGYQVGGPWGAGIGAGLGLLGNALGIGHKSRTKKEEHLRSALEKQGIQVPNSGVKEWELNPTFKASRKESDLTGKDIIHAGQFYANIPGYGNLDPTKQEAIANEALKEGLIREEHGTIDLKASDQFNKFAQAQLGAPVPLSTGGGGGQQDNRKQKSVQKKVRQEALLKSIIPDQVRAPNYEINPTPLFKNPYL